MTPREKAKELVGKHAFIFYMGDIKPIRLQEFNTHIYMKYAKKCARISVDEILKCDSLSPKEWNYWKEVRKEIESL